MNILLKTITGILVSILACTSFAQGENVHTFNSKSKAMNKDIPATIVLPDSYKSGNKDYAVVYLLHGFGGNHKTWVGIQPNLQKMATYYNLIFVCPDGAKSWFWDSPKDPSLKYETYVIKELIPQIDKKYRTIKDRKARAITGLSMGGHGALWLAFRHSDLFGACGSLSGGLDIRPFPNNWDMKKSLGEYADNKDIWDSHTVINQIENISPNSLAIAIDCGTSDFFYKVNENVHKKLLQNDIQHDYTTRPGAHTAEYWRNGILYQTLFFDEFFKSQKVK